MSEEIDATAPPTTEDDDEHIEDEEDTKRESSIKVIVRLRPLLDQEKKNGAVSTKVQVNGKENVIYLDPVDEKSKGKSFHFDAVLDETKTQEDVFEQAGVSGMIDSVLDGYDATVFAYGQTGSGKTFTMEGYQYEQTLNNLSTQNDVNVNVNIRGTSSSRLGLVPNATQTLFDKIVKRTEDSGDEFRVRCSYVQIYNEKILDLLNPGHLKKPTSSTGSGVAKTDRLILDVQDLAGLRMRFNSSNGHFFVEDLLEIECKEPTELLRQYERGVKAKVMGSHKLNASSSRSHCLFTIHIDLIDPLQPDQVKFTSRLCLIDLAGSERVSMTGAKGKTLKEASCINKSLFALRNVITAISAAQKEGSSASQGVHIPFRDSKLTSLLQHSLGGTSLTLMIACISPNDAHVDENWSTLAYAAKANKIKNKPTRNEDAKTKLIRKLRSEIKLLRKQLAHAQNVTAITLQNNQQTLLADTSGAAPISNEKLNELKRELLTSISMMKKMHEIELELRTRMELAEDRLEALQVDNVKLMSENQRLREREQVLYHLLESNDVPLVEPASQDKPKSSITSQSLVAKQLLELQDENARLRDTVTTLKATSSSQDLFRQTEEKPRTSSSKTQPPSKTQPLSIAPVPTPPPSDTKSLARQLSSEVAAVESKTRSKKKKHKRKPQVLSFDQLKTLLQGGGANGNERRTSTKQQEPQTNTVNATPPPIGTSLSRASPRRPLIVKPGISLEQSEADREEETRASDNYHSFLPKMSNISTTQISPVPIPSPHLAMLSRPSNSNADIEDVGSFFPVQGLSNLTDLLRTQSNLKKSRLSLI